MMRAVPLSLLVLSAAASLACGGGQSAAKTADDANTGNANTSASAATPSEPVASEETWEGEADATAAGTGESGAQAATAASSDEEARTTEVIGKVVRDNRKPFRACYEKGKAELPDLRGTMTLHFVLDPEGKVKLAELNAERSTIKSPVVVDCAVSVLKGLTFPPSSRGMESNVNYPFDFKP